MKFSNSPQLIVGRLGRFSREVYGFATLQDKVVVMQILEARMGVALLAAELECYILASGPDLFRCLFDHSRRILLSVYSKTMPTLKQQLHDSLASRDSGFLKRAKSKVFTYNTELRCFVRIFIHHTNHKTFADINAFLNTREKGSAPLTQDDDLIARVNFVQIPLTRMTAPMSPSIAIKRHLQCLSFETNQTTTTGRLCDKDNHGILFETPNGSVPYIRLSFNGDESESVRERWQVILIYDQARSGNGLDYHTFQTNLTGHGGILDAKLNIVDIPFGAFAIFLHNIILRYVQAVGEEMEEFMRAIEGIEKSMDSEERPSSLLRRLNTISRELKAASVKEKFVFSMDAAKWADAILKPLKYMDKQEDLLLLARGVEQYHPDVLREVATDVHQHIEDVIAERQQERQEQLQKREDARTEREEKLLEQSIRIAEETKRDSRTMRGIAWVTVGFLPATFVSSFFGMNFFNGVAGNVPFDEASRSVWLFFVVAIPISAVVLYTFHVWDTKEEKKAAKKKKEDEEELLISDKDKIE